MQAKKAKYRGCKFPSNTYNSDFSCCCFLTPFPIWETVYWPGWGSSRENRAAKPLWKLRQWLWVAFICWVRLCQPSLRFLLTMQIFWQDAKPRPCGSWSYPAASSLSPWDIGKLSLKIMACYFFLLKKLLKKKLDASTVSSFASPLIQSVKVIQS